MFDYEFEPMDIKQPPCAINAEKAVLGGLLIDSGRFSDVSAVIKPDDIFQMQHRTIYDAIWQLGESGSEIDVITVAEHLNACGKLDGIGGLPFLVNLADVPGTANIVPYARSIKDTAKQRALINTANQIVEIGYDVNLTTEEKISEAHSRLLSMESHRGEEAAQANSAIKAVVEMIDERFNSDGDIGIKTGFKDIDEKVNGFRNQNLVVLAARPAMGKTTLAMNIAEHNIRQDIPVLVFSAEMSREELMERMIASAGGIDLQRMRTGKLLEEDWPKLTAGVSILKDKPLFIDDRGGLTISQLRASARKQKARHDIQLIIVDYLQLLSADGTSREQEVSSISRGLKAMAKELNIPVIAISQLSRKCEERRDKRPLSSDLRDSGAIEQDADIIAFIYRDEVYNENTERKGVAEILFTKARGFTTGTVCLASRLDIGHFENLSFQPAPISESPIKGNIRGFSYDE